MNKTTNINLGGLFFHIDEDAYTRLRDYLQTIKHSFTDSQGRDEIIADIEARIAELFSEKISHERQVIGLTEVENIIAIMGEPEDYLVDEEIFEDEPQSQTPPKDHHQSPKSPKKLFRDPDDKYIGGVSSGLGHYIGVDALWIRLLWIFLIVAGFGAGIVIYVLLWILIPEAITTSQKLAMKGEPVNISNIEKKVREGFEEVSEKVRNVDYQKVGNKVKSGSSSFFDFLGKLMTALFDIFGKFIGILLVFIAASTLIGLFTGFIAAFVSIFSDSEWAHYMEIGNSSGIPIWAISLTVLFAVGIPFFLLFRLGMKILVDDLRSIGNTTKYVLLGLWILSTIALIVFGIRQATAQAYEGSIVEKKPLSISATDTLYFKNEISEIPGNRFYNSSVDKIVLNGKQKLYIENVIFDFVPSEDSLAFLNIEKEAESSSFHKAREEASRIDYDFSTEKNTVFLRNYALVDYQNKFRGQEVHVGVSLPEATVFFIDPHSDIRIGYETRERTGLYASNLKGHYWKVESGKLRCLDCEKILETDKTQPDDIKIDSTGIDINLQNTGSENVKVKIDKHGIEVKTGS
ncbi:PspC domain-containing protein [Sinomicrobium sp.]